MFVKDQVGVVVVMGRDFLLVSGLEGRSCRLKLGQKIHTAPEARPTGPVFNNIQTALRPRSIRNRHKRYRQLRRQQCGGVR